jgi:hypothetical protein
MKIKAEGDIDIISLFLHEKHDAWPFAEDFVATFIEEEIAKHTSKRVRVVPPTETGLDRFVLAVDDQLYAKRCHTELDFGRMIPDFLFKILKDM